MTINFRAPDIKELKPRILVLGVGGAGDFTPSGGVAAILVIKACACILSARHFSMSLSKFSYSN